MLFRGQEGKCKNRPYVVYRFPESHGDLSMWSRERPTTCVSNWEKRNTDHQPHGVPGVNHDMRHTIGFPEGILAASGQPTGMLAARFSRKTRFEAGLQGGRFYACGCDH